MHNAFTDDERVLGIDIAPEIVERHREAGRQMIQASATDSDFWSRLHLDHSTLRLVMLTLPQSVENATAAKLLLKNGYAGGIAALVEYDDEIEMLKEAGIHHVFNLYTEAGVGFAADASLGVIALKRPERLQPAGTLLGCYEEPRACWTSASRVWKSAQLTVGTARSVQKAW